MSFETLSINEAAVDHSTADSDQLLDVNALREALGSAPTPVPILRSALQQSNAILDERYKQNLNITEIVRGRAWVVDEILRIAWEKQYWPDANDISLVAVGGYGRGDFPDT